MESLHPHRHLRKQDGCKCTEKRDLEYVLQNQAGNRREDNKSIARPGLSITISHIYEV